MKLLVATLLPGILLLSACNGGVQSAAPVQSLVLDPTAVAKSLGRDELMQQQLNEHVAELNTRISQQTAELTAQLEKEKQKLGTKPDEAATRRYQDMLAAATQQAQQSRLQAQEDAAKYRKSLIGDFTAEIRAVAAKIAKARGAASVLVIGENVLWFDPAADITAEVIEKLRAESLQPHETTTDAASGQKKELKNLEAVIQAIERKEKDAP